VVDLDERTLAALTIHRSQLRVLSPLLAQDDAYVLGRLDGAVRHPERLSRSFAEHQQSAGRRYGIELPTIRLHDLQHTHATLYLRAGIHPKIVSERLGHANVTITLDVYSHTPSRRCSERQPRRSPRWSTGRHPEPRSITAVSRGPNQARQRAATRLTYAGTKLRKCPRGDLNSCVTRRIQMPFRSLICTDGQIRASGG
jgi:hypothetical protein